MNYLIDTHCLLWFQQNDARIPAHVMKVLKDAENRIYFSQISLLEIAIKQKVGKLTDFTLTISELYDEATDNLFVFLPLDNTHIEAYLRLPLFKQHRDPFDRLLVATAFDSNASVLTSDLNFKLYNDFIKVLW